MNPLSLLENSMPPSQKWTDKIQQAEISKDMVELNNTIHQVDKIDIYRLLHPTAVEYTFFSSSKNTHQVRPHSGP